MEKNLTKTKQQQYFFGDTPVTVHFVKGETITDSATKKMMETMQKKNSPKKETRNLCFIFRLSFYELRGNIYPCSLYIK